MDKKNWKDKGAGDSKGKKGKSTESHSKETVEVPKSIYMKDSKLYLIINGKPNSKINAIQGINDECIDVSIAAPAKDNEANTELKEYLSDVFGVKKTQIDLDKGSKSRNKLIVIEDSGLKPEEAFDIVKGKIS